MTDRAAHMAAFVKAAGWGTAEMRFLAGDASNRKYHRLRRGPETAVLMDAPPEKGEDVRPFLHVAGHLRALGLSAPDCLAADEAAGFLLLEDLGDDLYARVLERDPGGEARLYAAATDVLAHLHAHPAPAGLAAYDTPAMARAAGLAVGWYAFAITGERADPAPLMDEVAEALDRLAAEPPVVVLRDYHAENLLWLPGRDGLARVGLLDFQSAEMGQPAYDLISMLQDARRDVSPGVEPAMIRRFAAATGREEAQVARACAALGAQRALRILGTFARLSLHYGKPGYVRLIPRVWGQLQQNLAHPALAGLARAAALPPPSPAALQRITDQCGTIPTL